MIPRREFLANLDVASRVTADGAFVECGTWKGGMAAALIEVGGQKREYHFFDSFEGLPPAKEIDGSAALAWQSNTTSDAYYDNCSASVQEFKQIIATTGISGAHIHKGFFEQTLPSFNSPPVALLRLDADWYESTMICLEHLFDKVVSGGVILIDDYYTWDGCSRAVHDFLSKRQAPEKIEQKSVSLAVIVKS